MPGGLYAVSRKWFIRMGGYDTGLEVWGGENIEISFKTWMCGGSILLSVCSQIAHVFRQSISVPDPSINTKIQRNRQRVAEVWMDEYKHYYYQKLAYNLLNPGNLTNQRRLRVGLQCRNFRWYLDNVNLGLKEEMDIKGHYSGMIQHEQSGLCLQSDNIGPLLMPCQQKKTEQVWQFTSSGHLECLNKELSVTTLTDERQVKARWREVKEKVSKLIGEGLWSWWPKVNGQSREGQQENQDARGGGGGGGVRAITSHRDINVTSPIGNTTGTLPLNYKLFMAVIPRGRPSLYPVVFDYDKYQRLVHVDSHLCVEIAPDCPTIKLSTCTRNKSQRWKVQTRQEFRSLYDYEAV